MPDTTEKNDILTLADTAGEVRLSMKTVRKLIAAGEFAPSFRIGKKTFVRRVQLQRWIEEKEAETAVGDDDAT